MEQKNTTKWKVLLGIILIFAIIVVIILFIGYIARLFTSLQKEVIAAIIAATGTILVSVFSVLVTKHIERKRSIEQELRNKKIPMYESFVEFWFRLLFSKKLTGKPMTEKEMLEFFKQFTQQIMVWGSDGVIKKWSRYRSKMGNVGDKDFNMELMLEFESILMEIRKDTGHKNKNIVQGDLLGLFINDIDNHLGERSQRNDRIS